jgi:hypothetical protein
MTARLTDLDSCATEPIRVPGAVQPRGRMLVLTDGRWVGASDPVTLHRDLRVRVLDPARYFLPQQRRDASLAATRAACA